MLEMSGLMGRKWRERMMRAEREWEEGGEPGREEGEQKEGETKEADGAKRREQEVKLATREQQR